MQSTDGVASGPISFIRVFNAATDVIKQGGRRRGANMGILNVWHPDILAFIAMKREEGDVANFNLSVMVDDRFMDLVDRKEFGDVWLVHPVTGESVTVGEIWTGIVDGIWKNGEPGVLFYDEINRHNPTPQLGVIDTTNPCGEQPLLPYESCVLGSINLAAFVSDGASTWTRSSHRPDGRPVPRHRDRPERLPDRADRRGDPADPEDRPRAHGGPRRHADDPPPVRLPGGPGLVRACDGAGQ